MTKIIKQTWIFARLTCAIKSHDPRNASTHDRALMICDRCGKTGC